MGGYPARRRARVFVRGNLAVTVKRTLDGAGIDIPFPQRVVDDKGQDIFEATRPKEFDELQPVLKPRGEKAFFGVYDPDAPPQVLAERFVSLMPASAKDSMPAGDFREWPAIDAWAAEIPARLQTMG
jgi:menaquinone-dependent protoporphyrinogen oxidase